MTRTYQQSMREVSSSILWENRYVLSCLQKVRLESMDLIREGSEFQAEGPATENALLAIFVLVLG